MTTQRPDRFRLHRQWPQAVRHAASWAPWVPLAVMIVAFGVEFSWLSVARHHAYQSHSFDLANMDQAVWNTLHGHLLRFTTMSVGRQVLTSRLAIHVEPLLLPLSLLYLIHGGVETLLITQAWVVALGAIPAYLLARALLKRRWLALVFPATYLLHPSLQNALLDDFHAVAMSAPLLLCALYCVRSGSIRWFAMWTALAMSTKEEIGLLVALLGLALILLGRRRAGIIALVVGVGWFLVCVTLIIPAFNPAGHSPYLQRYGYLGHGLGGIVLGVVRHPDVVGHVLVSTPRLEYLILLLHPLGFVSVLGLPVLLLALPSFLINMLSADPTMYSGYYQYSVEIVPYTLVAAMVALAWTGAVALRRRTVGNRILVPFLACFVLIAAVWDTRDRGFSTLAAGYIVPSAGPHQRLENRIIARVPADAVAAAADEMVPHLSERKWMYKLPVVHPVNGPPAEYIALDATIPSVPILPSTLHSVAERALHGEYGIDRAGDGILLLRRGATRRQLPSSFFSFLFSRPSRLSPLHARWGTLSLLGVVLHPTSAVVNTSRPDIAVDTYWRTTRPLPHSVKFSFFMSPPYTGPHPGFSSAWTSEPESPAWVWLPPSRWPTNRTVRAISLPMVPVLSQAAKVDIAVGVQGTGAVHGVGSGTVKSGSTVVRLATVTITAP